MAESAGRRSVERVADLLELPRDVVLDLPRLTLVGKLQLTVENHRGLVEYTPERVRIAVHEGEIVVTGRGLAIGSVYRDEMIIGGRIDGLELR